MQTVKFIHSMTVEVDSATKLTYPKGWVGEVDEDTAALALEEGCIEAASKPKVAKSGTSKGGKPKVAKSEAKPESDGDSAGDDAAGDAANTDAPAPPV